jgi:hypothetical protein
MRALLLELAAIARDAESLRELAGALWVLAREGLPS